MFPFQQFRIKTTSLGVVFHALSHSVLSNEFEFDFSSKVLIFLGFDLMYIATWFSRLSINIFKNLLYQWIARIFLHQLVYIWKESIGNRRVKNRKTLAILIILTRQKWPFVFQNFLLYRSHDMRTSYSYILKEQIKIYVWNWIAIEYILCRERNEKWIVN